MPHQSPLERPATVAERGVYEHPFVGPNGERYLFAVDRSGQRILEATIYRSIDDPAAVTEVLRSILDREDPAPVKIQIVR